MVCAAAVFVVSLVVYYISHYSHSARLLLLTTAVASTAIGELKVAEFVSSQSPFLIYFIGHPLVEAPLGWCSIGILGVEAVFVMGLCRIRRFGRGAAGAAACFPALILLLGCVGFVIENYVSKSENFVRAIVCLDRENGEIRWTCEGLTGEQEHLERYNRKMCSVKN